MAWPDAVITAVGTRVFSYDDDGGGGGWVEDAAWSRSLDEGWSVQAVRQGVHAAMSMVGVDCVLKRTSD